MENTAVATSSNGVSTNKPKTLKGMLDDESIKKRFTEIMGDKAAGFMSSILNIVNGNTNLSMADPQSVIMSAAVAATLDLPINPNLGFAYIIPYQQNKQVNGQWVTHQVAQFQMGYKGFIQLALRTGQYKKINAVEVRAGQLIKWNPLTEEHEFDFSKNEDKEIIGYIAYFQLLNGFEKTVYWNIGKITDHAKKHSKSFGKKTSPWTTNFNEMCMKTLIKHILSKYGVLSIDMQKAVSVDQAVILDEKTERFDYADSTDLSSQKTIDATHTEMESNFTKDAPASSNDAPASGEAQPGTDSSLDLTDL